MTYGTNRFGSSTTFKTFQSYKPLHTIIHKYVDLGCFLIPAPMPSEWWSLNRRKRVLSLYELEIRFGKSKTHDRLLHECFENAQTYKRTIFGERLGLKDMIVPVFKNKKTIAFFFTESFFDKEITFDMVKRVWTEVSGLEVNPALPEYREFVKAVLETPVLDDQLLPAYQECFELFGRLLADDKDVETIAKRTSQLLTDVIAKGVPHSYWMDWALGRPSTDSTPVWSKALENWEWTQTEIGISRIPTTVLVVIPHQTGNRNLGWTEEMIKINQFQRRSFAFAKTIPQTVGGKLENYGAVFVTSADPSKPRLIRRKQIKDIAERIRKFAQKEWGGQVLVGVGESVPQGEPLKESFRQALLALHVGLPSENGMIFKTQPHAKKTDGILELNRLLQEILGEFKTVSFSDIAILRDGFIRQIMLLSLPNFEEVRCHFKYALLQLMEVIRERTGLKEKEAEELYKTQIRFIENAGTSQEMVHVFQESLEKMMELMEGTGFQKIKSMEKILDFVDKHFREPMRVLDLAQMADISAATFSRRFKKSAGMGLEDYLQNRRIDEAKFLLKIGNLSGARVGQDCGFKSKSHFVQLFKKKTGFTPQKYREKFQKA